ncbi:MULTISPECIES: hypothetical protein [Paraburkholderia]|uniref:hypothetical protein n=1 Tax=Paraburkholderia TaxID=1822464 RepID=UPI0038BE094E
MDDELIDQRFELVADQIAHLSTRVDDLEGKHEEHAEAKESRHSRFVNWLMLGLFAAEVAIGIFQIAWVSHHA